MKMMSIGDQLAKLLGNNTTRQELHYRHNRVANPNVISDFFDGAMYNNFVAKGNFQNKDDIAVALFLDGFVNRKKSKEPLTIVHVMVLNYDPIIRYTDKYLFQLAIIPGKIVDLDSFLLPIVDELNSLGKYGMVVKKFDGEIIKSKVHLMLASGDIPQVSKFMHHKGHVSTFGCRVCEVKGEHPVGSRRGMYFLQTTAQERTMDSFENGNAALGITGESAFRTLPSFCGTFFHPLEEMHMLGHGIGKLIYRLLVKTNQGNEHLYFHNDKSAKHYPFTIDKKQLLAAGKSIDASRAHIPVSFQGSWDNIINKLDGVRAVDYLDFLLFVVPTLLVPLLQKNKTRTAVMNLVQGCSIALQWELTEDSIVQMESCFDKWHAYLKEEITKKHLSKSVFTINNHYLSHIGATIRQAGSLRVYSTRSMERTIGRYAKLIKSTVYGVKTSLDNYKELSDLSIHNHNHQLWSPSNYHSLSSLEDNIEGVPSLVFLSAIQSFYIRQKGSVRNTTITVDTTTPITTACRALLHSHVFNSQMYRVRRKESRRGNHYISFRSEQNNKIVWYVGAVQFYFSHFQIEEQFLACVQVFKSISPSVHNSSIPLVQMHPSIQSKYVVISLNDVSNQVGLIQSSEYPTDYYVVWPYCIFDTDMKKTAGRLDLI
ncbi:unnamed protein product [Mucor hiemalis]